MEQTGIKINLSNLLISLSYVMDLLNIAVAEHQTRTAYIAVEIARELGIHGSNLENIFAASLLHDIGAITLEEKIALHQFEDINVDQHCIRGEMLLSTVPYFNKISKIIRLHHTKYTEIFDRMNESVYCSAQILSLADYIERLIDRKKYILFQKQDILDAVKLQSVKMFHPEYIKAFISLSGREEFWFDLTSAKYLNSLKDNSPYNGLTLDLSDVNYLTKLFAKLIDFKSHFTYTHSAGVSACVEKLCAIKKTSDEEGTLMVIAGNLHDVGKLTIPSTILEKEGALTVEEFEIIKSHSYYTYHILKSIDGFENVSRWAAFHHEKLDKSGYPFRYSGATLDENSKIMTVSDIFTALAEKRPYRDGMKKDQIYTIFKQMSDDNKIDKCCSDMIFDNYDNISKFISSAQIEQQKYYDEKIFSN